MKKTIGLIILLLTAGTIYLAGQDKLPVPGNPSSWVNDYAGVFSTNERRQLEEKLNRFELNSSTQIFVVTLNDNGGYTASDLAPRIGELWGVGQKGKDNGIIVLMDMAENEVFISTGYGIEEYIPDAIASRIVRNEILPRFREGDFYAGLSDGIDVMTSLLEGTYTPDEYLQQTEGSVLGGIIGMFIIILVFMVIFGGNRRRSVGMGSSNLPLWIALGMLSSRTGHSGKFGNFSSGGGGFGGFSGGGGFGGFSGGGGGSFGGGGAGGKW